jgi:uncharacterized protein (DUF2345 family)
MTATDLAAEMGEEHASMTQHCRPTRRVIGWRLAVAGAVLAPAVAGAHVALAAGHTPAVSSARTARAPSAAIPAREARTVSVNDTGHLKLLHASGEILIEEGPTTGTLPGTARVRLDVGSETVTATFTIRVRGGDSISGTGRAKIGTPGRYTSFGGTLIVSRGTGRYAHAHGAGKLYGVLERKYDTLTVQAREGTLDY